MLFKSNIYFGCVAVFYYIIKGFFCDRYETVLYFLRYKFAHITL